MKTQLKMSYETIIYAITYWWQPFKLASVGPKIIRDQVSVTPLTEPFLQGSEWSYTTYTWPYYCTNWFILVDETTVVISLFAFKCLVVTNRLSTTEIGVEKGLCRGNTVGSYQVAIWRCRITTGWRGKYQKGWRPPKPEGRHPFAPIKSASGIHDNHLSPLISKSWLIRLRGFHNNPNVVAV